MKVAGRQSSSVSVLLPLDSQERESIPWQSFVAYLRFETPRPASFERKRLARWRWALACRSSLDLLIPSPAEVCPAASLMSSRQQDFRAPFERFGFLHPTLL